MNNYIAKFEKYLDSLEAKYMDFYSVLKKVEDGYTSTLQKLPEITPKISRPMLKTMMPKPDELVQYQKDLEVYEVYHVEKVKLDEIKKELNTIKREFIMTNMMNKSGIWGITNEKQREKILEMVHNKSDGYYEQYNIITELVELVEL